MTRDFDRGKVKKNFLLKLLLIPQMHKLRTLSSMMTHIFITTDTALKTVLGRFSLRFWRIPTFPSSEERMEKRQNKMGGGDAFFLKSLSPPPLYHLSSFKFICQLLFLPDAMKVIFLPFLVLRIDLIANSL